jgi:pimeloyl-ACP methyl ester carboxylesterase
MLLMLLPFQVLGIWFRGLIALLLLAAGTYLLQDWYRQPDQVVTSRVGEVPVAADEEQPNEVREQPNQVREQPTEVREVRSRWTLGFDRETAELLGGIALVFWSCGGGWSVNLFRRSNKTDAPQRLDDGAVQSIDRPDGTRLHVRSYGPQMGTPVVLIHGWGLDMDEWTYACRDLAVPIRLIVWDLPGLGRSKGPSTNDWSLEKLARDLEAILDAFPGQRPIVVGHSIGGMIVLTYCRLFSPTLAQRVRGIVIGHSTYTNPVRTTSKSGLYTALQKPVLEPLCHLMVWLAPLVWLLNWLSYINGSAHRSTHGSFFSGNESREQLNFISRYYVTAWPAVVARGMLAMFRYDATAVLPAISVPTLIVTGDRDTTCLPAASITMRDTIPRATYVNLASSRHGGLFEFHQQFAEALSGFINETASAATSRKASA